MEENHERGVRQLPYLFGIQRFSENRKEWQCAIRDINTIHHPRRTTSTRAVTTPADTFKRGIKRDPSYFGVLKEARGFDEWHRNIVSEAASQDVSNVLDSTYVPPDQDAETLFKLQNNYMYSVFIKVLKTDIGKSIVRAHQQDRDAQKVYEKVINHYLKSTKALISTADLLSYITSASLKDGNWKGTMEAYILHWEDQVRLYESQTDTADHFNQGMKKTMLQNAVSSVEELRSVKNQADQHRLHSGTELTYEEYSELLKSAAQSYDTRVTSRTKSITGKRSVYKSDIYYDDQGQDYDIPQLDDRDSSYLYQANMHDYIMTDESEVFSDDQDRFDIDAPLTLVQAHAHKSQGMASRDQATRTSTPRIPPDKWAQMDFRSKKAWNSMSPSMKTYLLGMP